MLFVFSLIFVVGLWCFQEGFRVFFVLFFRRDFECFLMFFFSFVVGL